ncbi:MAG: molybdopterin-dependent oxidoreductase [Halobacteriaceae archaeon]
MIRVLRRTARTLLNALQPPPSHVDWSIFFIVTFEVASGLISFVHVSPASWPWFWAHRIAGLTLIALLAFKFIRVRDRVLDPGQWERSTHVSVLAGIVAIGASLTGVVWVLGVDIRVARWTLLSIHVGLGLVLLPLVGLHLGTRFRPPSTDTFDRRRTSLKFIFLLLVGTVVYRMQEVLNDLLGLHGATRRVTGSHPRQGSGNSAFPITSWVADDPEPIDPAEWSLTVQGQVESPTEIEHGDLHHDDERRALLDCTSGWYTIQRWRGIRVADLLDEVDPHEDAQFVRFVSITGYRWSLPIDEARDALLATHVGNERLSHGHGAPLRLVAPGRRGFQWVKWIERVDVRRRADPAQWLVTLISGFD